MPSPSQASWLGPRWIALVLALLVAVVLLREQPPSPRGADVPVNEFSAARAAEHIAALLPHSTPHPIGSQENLAVRDRLVQRLRTLGFEPEVTEAVACRPHARCGLVRNVMIRITGQAPGPAVLVAVHYDSVPAGPGVGDDLSGVSVALETALAIAAGPTPRRPVWILFDDGEEAGLLGARAFTDDPELVAGVGVVVNVEARGTGGLARMFETSGPNAWLVGVAASAAPRPSLTSLSVEIYRRLPNDTDLTVFREANLPGVNHAFIRNLSHYHSPLDDLAHLDRGTLQHQGDTVLATTRRLADASTLEAATYDAVYSDVLGLFVLSWPAGWSMALALLGAALALGAAWLAVRGGHARASTVVVGLGGALAAVVVAGLLAFLVGAGISLMAGTAVPPAAVPGWAAACVLSTVALVTLGIATALGGERAVAAGVGAWLLWAGLGLVTAATIPGASILFVVPTLVGAGALVVGLLRGGRANLLVLPGVVTAAVLVGPLTVAVFDAFEFGAFAALAVPLALVATTALPGLGRPSRGDHRRPLLVLLAVVAVTMIASSLAPLHTEAQPGTLNLIRVEDRVRGESTWYAETRGAELPLPGFDLAPEGPPGTWGPTYRKGAAPGDDTGARLEARGGGRYRLTSPRGSTVVGIAFPGGTSPGRVTVGGRPVQPTDLRWFDGTRRAYFDVVGLPADGLEVELGVPVGTTVELVDVAHRIAGAEADALRAARPSTFVPKHGGDRDLLVTTHALPGGAG